MNERLQGVKNDVLSDPNYNEQTHKVEVEIVHYGGKDRTPVGIGFDEFVIQLDEDGTWFVTTRLGV